MKGCGRGDQEPPTSQLERETEGARKGIGAQLVPLIQGVFVWANNQRMFCEERDRVWAFPLNVTLVARGMKVQRVVVIIPTVFLYF